MRAIVTVLLTVLALAACSDDAPPSGSADAKAAVGSFQNPEMYTTPIGAPATRYYCLQGHVYAGVGHSVTPIFDTVNDRALACPTNNATKGN